MENNIKNICECCVRDYEGRIRSLIEEDEYIHSEKSCVLHSKNKEKDLILFKKSFNEIIEKINQSLDDEIPWKRYLFRNIYFPKKFSFENTLLNENIKNNLTVFFHKCTFFDDINLKFFISHNEIEFKNTNFDKNIFFNELTNNKLMFDTCYFKETFRIHDITFENNIKFTNSTFYKEILFVNVNFSDFSFQRIESKRLTVFNNVKIDKYIFSDVNNKEIKFNNTTFGIQYEEKEEETISNLIAKKIDLSLSTNLPIIELIDNCCIDVENCENISINAKSKKIKRLSIKGTKIKSLALKNCDINITIIENNEFEDSINFKESTFINGVVFENNISNKISNFMDTKFLKELELNNLTFKENINFLGIQINELNRETARIIKDSFEKQNNIIEANKFYALEMKEREKELSPKKDFFEWLVFKFHGLSSNHSQDWFLSLLWIIIFSFVVGLFNKKYYFEIDKYIFISLILIVPILIGLKFDEIKRKIGLSLFIILFYLNTSINLNFVSNLINPFSIMTGKDELTFGILIYKITIAYLIYQLIISIRQNTRRK